MRRRAVVVFLVLALFAGGSLAYFGGFRLPDFALLGDNDLGTSEAAPETPSRAGDTPEEAAIAALERRPGASGDKPKFDIARIDPEGASVFAGRAAPRAAVTVLENGHPVGSVTADENGEWALTVEHKFTSPDPKLTLEARPEGAPGGAAAAVTGSLPAQGASRSTGDAGSSPVARRFIQNLEDMVAAARRETAETTAGRRPEEAVPPARDAPGAASPAVGSWVSVPPARDAPPSRVAAAAPAGQVRASPPPPPRAAPPIPITFVYREAAFTDDGRRAVGLLLEYLKLKKLAAVSLSGHADEIGGDVYNLALSKDRLDAVSRFLRDGGYAGRLDLVPKGKSEPFAGVDRSRLTEDEAHQLDRRVELHLTR